MKIFYQQLGGECMKAYEHPDAKGVKYRKRKNKNAKWINNIEKELQGLKEGLKMKRDLDSLRGTLKKVPN